MALWNSTRARATVSERQATDLDVSEHDADFLGDLMPESNMSIEKFRPKTSVIRANMGDLTEDVEWSAHREGPAELRMKMYHQIVNQMAYGRAGGDQGQAIRVRTRNSPNLRNAAIHGGDVKPRLITEEKLIELGFVDALGNPFNPAGLRRNIVSHRCTCIHSV